MPEILPEKTIKLYAQIFADVLKRTGVISANTTSFDTGSDVVQNSSIQSHKEQQKRQSLLRKNNKLLDEYLTIQKNINKTGLQDEKSKKRRREIETDLQNDSILLGKSYVTAANSIKNNDFNLSNIKKFINDDNLNKLSSSFSEKIEDAGDIMSDSIVETSTEIHTKTSRAYDKLLSSFIGRATIGAALVDFMGEFRAGLKYGSDLMPNISKSIDAFKMGIDPSDLIELEAKNKRLVNAMGGADKFEEAMASGSSTMFEFYGDLSEATKGTIHSMSSLQMAGITPTLKMLESQTGALSKMTKVMDSTRTMTGQTFAEQNAALEEYIKSDSIKSKLVTASNSAERLAIIQRGIANKNLLSSLGLTADQAERVAESFNSITGMDPKDRLKESYKAQATMGALGIEGAKEFGEIIRMGGFNAAGVTDEMREKGLKAVTEMARLEAESKSGVITAEGLMVSALVKNMAAFQGITKEAQELILANKTKNKEAADKEKEKDRGFFSSLYNNTLTGVGQLSDMVTTGITSNALLKLIFGSVLVIANEMRRNSNNKGLGKFGKYARDKFSSAKNKVGTTFGNLKNKTGNLYGKAAEGLSKTKIGSTLGGAGKLMGTAAGGILSGGKSILKFGGKLLGKAALPLVALSSITDGIQGWQNAASKFKSKEITTGMKAASAFGEIVSGLTFGALDSKDVAKFTYGDLPNGTNDKNTTGVLDKKNNIIKPVDKINQNISDSKINKKTNDVNNKIILLQEQMLAMQSQNTELIKMTNGILENNFEKLHSSNTKYLRSNMDIKDVLISNGAEDLQLSRFDDNSYSFV